VSLILVSFAATACNKGCVLISVTFYLYFSRRFWKLFIHLVMLAILDGNLHNWCKTIHYKTDVWSV